MISEEGLLGWAEKTHQKFSMRGLMKTWCRRDDTHCLEWKVWQMTWA